MVVELLATVLVLALTGAGVASLLTPLSRDVQAALALPLGWALVAATAPLVDAGAPPRALTAATVVAGIVLTLARARAVASLARNAGWPAIVVAATLLVSAGPAIERGTWAAETQGNADPYLWVSQARTLVDGLTIVGASDPDALATERLATQHWSEAPPVGLAALSGATGHDPAFVVFLLIAVLSLLTPLVTYVAARAVVELPAWVAAVAGTAVGVAALHQLAVVVAWIPQLGGASLALAAGVLLRSAYDAGGARRPALAAALCVAGALATYRLPVSGILAVTIGVAFVSALVERRRPIVGPTLWFGAAALVLAAPSLLELVQGLGNFVENQLSEADWETVARVRPWEGLGMSPRDVQFGLQDSPWSVVPAIVAVTVLVIGAVAVRRRSGGAFALLGLATGVAGAIVLPLAGASPYLSFKLVGYTAPFAMIVAVAPLAVRRDRLAVRVLYAVAALMLVSGTLRFGDEHWRQSGAGSIPELRAVAAEASARARGGAIEIAVEQPRAQAWLVYFLRDVPVSLPCPSGFFTGIGLHLDATRYVRPSAVSIVMDYGRPLEWSRGELGLVRGPVRDPGRCAGARPAGLVEAAGVGGA